MSPPSNAEPRPGDARPEPNHWLVRPENIRRLWILFILILVATVVPDPFIHQHVDFGVEDMFGFYAVYGFLTCVAMVLFAKLLGAFLKRSDRYYGD